MKSLCLLFSLIFLYHNSISQNNNKKIDGIVLDSLSNQPLPHATIQLTTTNVKLYITADINGKYTFKKLTQGDYEIIGNYVGYRSKKIRISIGETDEITVPTIALSLENINLKEVTVKATRPFIEQSMDKIVLNVAESIMANSGSSLDILRRSPSVQVNDNDGSISLKGKKVMILIDGKPTQLTGENLEGFLSAMPSNSIDRIELISNPSVKYEATGMAVINIRTLKMKNMGINGSWSLGANMGKYIGYNGNILLNYRNNKITLIGNYSHQLIHHYVNISSFRTLINNHYFGDYEFHNRARRLQYYKLGFDYDFSKTTTIGILFQGDMNDRTLLGNNRTLVGKDISFIDSTIVVDTDSKAQLSNWNLNLSFRHQFPQKGRGLTVDAAYGQYNADWNEYFGQQFFENITEISYKPDNQIWFPWFQKNKIQTLKSDYVHPLSSGTIETGIQIRSTQMNMDFEFQENKESQWIKNRQKSFNYNYTENVQAAYLSYSGKKNKINYQTGLRYEQTQVKIAAMGINGDTLQNYGNLFPSISLQYIYDKKRIITLSYTNRITRPTYSQLNERPVYFNPYRQTLGNAYLKPTLTTSFETGLTINQQWFFTLGYIINKNDISLIPTLIGNTTGYKSYNFNKSEVVSLDIVFNSNLKKWWNTNTGLQYFYTFNNFRNLKELSTNQSHSFYFRSTNYLTLKNGFKIELTGFYYPSQVSGAFKIFSLKKLDVGIQKSVLSNKADVRLNITDVFNSLTTRYLFRTNGVSGNENMKYETRFIKFSFLYRFGNSNIKIKDRKSGIDKENNRLDK